MPEGPEVKRVGVQLAERLSGRTLKGIELLSGRYTKKDPSGYPEFLQTLPKKIVGAGVHGKFIYILCDDAFSIWNTLGMTGTWSLEQKKHSRVKFILDDGVLYYTDMRNFGTLKFARGKEALLKKLKSLGPDLLAEDVSDDVFKSRLRKRPEKTLAEVLMDQRIVAGIGNYVKAEALWFSKLSPHRTVSSLSDEEISRLNSCVKKVLRDSYESGGATIKTYESLYGGPGDFSSRLCVYGRDLDAQGHPVLREKTKDGRTTWWVPEIQK